MVDQRYPAAVECVDRDLEELLAVFGLVVAQRRMVHAILKSKDASSTRKRWRRVLS